MFLIKIALMFKLDKGLVQIKFTCYRMSELSYFTVPYLTTSGSCNACK